MLPYVNYFQRYVLLLKKARNLVFIIELNNKYLKIVTMSKERDVEILKHKITELEEKIINFVRYDISDKKMENLRIRLLMYEDQLAELVYGT